MRSSTKWLHLSRIRLFLEMNADVLSIHQWADSKSNSTNCLMAPASYIRWIQSRCACDHSNERCTSIFYYLFVLLLPRLILFLCQVKRRATLCQIVFWNIRTAHTQCNTLKAISYRRWRGYILEIAYWSHETHDRCSTSACEWATKTERAIKIPVFCFSFDSHSFRSVVVNQPRWISANAHHYTVCVSNVDSEDTMDLLKERTVLKSGCERVVCCHIYSIESRCRE